ncbi:MAG TPA: RagB/SusD family nutrient uptake outer membrane protein [Gemmatimonadaceae bacterium]|nr:RagB/SusD family nutrient uptake outer membrane protein [Gemmatimonadaceae bacterium]
MRTYMRITLGTLGIAAAGAALGGCNFDVSNPGPVQGKYLNDPRAAQAIVNGAGRDLSEALNWIAYTGAAVSREVFPAGSTGSFGITPNQQIGLLTDDETNTHWDLAQRARFEADSGNKFMKRSLTDYAKNKLAAQILLWSGYTYRLLGENMCEAVIDGSAAMPSTAFLDSAIARFTTALGVAQAAGDTRSVSAALAGRASVLADLGRWPDAIADAQQVADGFVYQMPYYVTDVDQYNRIYWATANQPYRAHTVWNTPYETYYASTKDPRVPWDTSTSQKVGDAAVLSLGRVQWHFETKFSKKDAAMNLSSGWEMRLLEAENLLMGGDVPNAMMLINKHRVALKLQPWSATTADEAWTALKRERGIELWLEGRRLGDLRRWKATSAPGDLSPLEQAGSATSYLSANQNLCFPIPLSEKQTNPHFTSP